MAEPVFIFFFSENRSTVGYNVLCDIFLVLVEISLLFSSMQNCPTVCFSFQYFHLEFVQGIRVFHERKSRLDQLTGWGLRHHTNFFNLFFFNNKSTQKQMFYGPLPWSKSTTSTHPQSCCEGFAGGEYQG